MAGPQILYTHSLTQSNIKYDPGAEVKFCQGARWAEAERLDRRSIFNSYYRMHGCEDATYYRKKSGYGWEGFLGDARLHPLLDVLVERRQRCLPVPRQRDAQEPDARWGRREGNAGDGLNAIASMGGSKFRARHRYFFLLRARSAQIMVSKVARSLATLEPG
jgi:hypothetical protein